MRECSEGRADENRLHPYTKALFEAFLSVNPWQRPEIRALMGYVPSPINPLLGCHFHPRCPHAMDICRESYPALKEIAPGHSAACHLYL